MENSSSSSILCVDEFFASSRPHITEHILSFCSIEDLRSVATTCITLRDFVTQSKFRFNINFGNGHKNALSYKEIEDCLKTRKFKALRITGDRGNEFSDANQNENFNKLFTMTEHFSEVEDLKLFSCKFTQNQYVNIFEIFPSMKKCWIDECENVQPASQIQELTQHDSLIELSLVPEYLLYSLELLDCKNLKKLFIAEVKDREDMNGNSFWQHLRLEPEEIEIHESGWTSKPNFVKFLRRQTKLKQVTCETDSGTCKILLQLPSVERFNVSTICDYSDGYEEGKNWCCLSRVMHECPYVNLSKVPHHRLGSFWMKKGFYHSNYFEYSPNAPKDVEMFERDVLDFLVKNSNLIACVTIGKKSWLEAGFGLSGYFVKKLIENLPKLNRLELFSGSNCYQIIEDIIGSGRNFKAVKIHAKDGGMNFEIPEEGEEEVSD